MSSESPKSLSSIQSLQGIERLLWIFSAFLCIGAAILGGPKERLGMVLGTCLMVGNFAFWRRLISRFLQKQSFFGNGESQPAVYKLILLGHAKLILLVGSLYCMVRFLPVNPLFLLIGLLVLPMAAFGWVVFRTMKTLTGQDRFAAASKEGERQ